MPTREERLQKKIEDALHIAKTAKAELERLRKEQDRKTKIAERKARTRRLIELGGLVELAELSGTDKGTLLGMLLAGKSAMDKPEVAGKWKTQGDSLLAERERQKAAPPEGQPTEATDDPNA